MPTQDGSSPGNRMVLQTLVTLGANSCIMCPLQKSLKILAEKLINLYSNVTFSGQK